MPIYRDKENGCWRFEFNRRIPGHGRVRARKRLPKTWSRHQADAFDREETARLYALATGTEKPAAGIERAVELYVIERLPQLKAGKRTAQELLLCLWAYEGKTLAQLADVAATIRKRWAGELAPATIRNRIRYLTAACRWAWKHHHLCDHDPAERVTVPQADNERQVYTDRAGMLLMAQQAKPCPETRALIRIAFYSGMRLGEILRVEVDHERQLFKLPDTKNGEPRWIPVHARIRSAVRYLPFTLSRTTLMKRWRLVRGAVLMDHLHFHDMRHTTASEMINSGVDLYTVGAVLGHKSAQSTKRYSHMATRTLAEALAKVGQKAA
jgi:integrase